MRLLTNDFSWSKSRHEKFRECRRAYFFHYYQSWGGWAQEAPKPTRELYVLKKLSNRFTWAGSVLHEAVRGVLMALRHGRLLDAQRLTERVHGAMQQDFIFSRAKRYWTERHRKEFTGLVEHEYAEEVPKEAWRANWETVRGGLDWFFQSRWPQVAQGLRPQQWLEVDLLDFEQSFFTLDGVKVFAVPDFAYVDHDGTTVVVDWKTGKAREGYDDQVLGYALYLQSRYGLPVSNMRAVLVYVNDGLEQSIRLEEAAVEGFRRKFADSVAGMRSLLLDREGNVPLPESAFPKTEDQNTCARCPFRRPCGREAQSGALRAG